MGFTNSVCLFAVLPLAAPLAAQCSNVWLPGDGLPGVSGNVRATTTWDPDGAGPAPTLVIVAGDFLVAGAMLANRIAAWDPTTGGWSALGTGIAGVNTGVHALTTLQNGDLVAGGYFTTAGGVSANGIARWDGAAWSALGTGMSGGSSPVVQALTTLPNGDLIAGGFFTTAGGVPVNNIARWDGAAWSALGTGVDSVVWALTTLLNGDVVAGGHFTTAGGVLVNRIARWDGVLWSSLSTGMNLPVRALTTLPNGDLVAGGLFTTAGGVVVSRIARWDGAVWSPLGTGINNGTGQNNDVYALTMLPTGDLIAGGNFTTAGGVSANRVARWNGTAWSALGIGIGPGLSSIVNSVTALPNGDVVVGGAFGTAGGGSAFGIARWDGAAWSALSTGGTGMNSTVNALTALPNGDLVAGGTFTTTSGGSANRIARWDGASWSALSTGMNGSVNALTTLPNGDMIAGGQFTTAGGTSATNIARWDGAVWSAVGTGTDGSVYALTTLPNGDLVASGIFTMAGGVSANHIARWDGAAWSALGTGIDGSVNALTPLPNGDVVAGGVFSMAGGLPANRIARWDGVAWKTLGTGIPVTFGTGVYALTTLPNGDVVAGGVFATIFGFSTNYIARWDGAVWLPFGAGMNNSVHALTTLPNGDLIAAGGFTMAGGVPANRIARWDGAAWSALGTGVDGFIFALTTLPNGDVAVGGNFITAGGTVSVSVARLTTTCPAIAASYGAGCASSGGSNTLVATSLPWVDAVFHSQGSGLPNSALVVAVTGFGSFAQGQSPLASLLPPLGVPGCDLLVQPDILHIVPAAAGTAQFAVLLPNTPPLVGATFFHQMVPFELDAQGNLVAITSTNALQLTAGAF